MTPEPRPNRAHNHVTINGKGHGLTGAQVNTLLNADDTGSLPTAKAQTLCAYSMIARGMMQRTQGRYQLTELGLALRAVLKHRAGRDGRTVRQTP